jgi:hypothetical protein
LKCIQKNKKPSPETSSRSTRTETSKHMLVIRKDVTTTDKTQEPHDVHSDFSAPFPTLPKACARLVSFGGETPMIIGDKQDPSTIWYSKEDLSMLLNHEVSISWRSATNKSNPNKAVGKTMHCGWRGLEHIRLLYNKAERNSDHVAFLLAAQGMLQ